MELNRSSWYYEPAGESAENLALMRRLDEQYLATPCYGSRKMAKVFGVNRKRVQRLMQLMGLEAIYPKPRTTQPNAEHRIYPYLLRNVEVARADQVWSSDITYVPMPTGFMYLTVVLDWYSRHVLSWRLSNTLDSGFCLEALEEALSKSRPEIFNSDQGAQGAFPFLLRRFWGKVGALRVDLGPNAGSRWVMEGKQATIRERWLQRAEAAYRRMFEGKSAAELVTLTQRETMAVAIAKELAEFLLEEHVAADPAAQPAEASATCCPKCGQAGTPAVPKGKELPQRTVRTRAGELRLRRQRWRCAKCRIVFFSAGRSAGTGDGRL